MTVSKKIVYGLTGGTKEQMAGAIFKNARHFSGVDKSATDVYLVEGDWSVIRGSYQLAGINVHDGYPGDQKAESASKQSAKAGSTATKAAQQEAAGASE